VALRLANAKTPAAPAAAARPDRVLVDQARAALRAGELDRLPALAHEAAAVADPHRRYVARRDLVELGLAASQQARGAHAARLLLATAQTALAALADAPAEPVLLNLAGVALYELGALQAADTLFAAAGALDPELPHLARNRQEVRRRRRQSVSPDLPPAVTRALPPLGRAAASVAAAARPADAASISLCMIVRDEEAVLERCLAAAAPHVDELVVVDTGSTDRTVEIARAFGARVLHHAWDDDFAAARNVGLDAATGDWILFLDADEVLVAEDAARLRELVRRTWREAFLLTITNYVGGEHDGTAVANDTQRLFRNRPAHRFAGRIHESVAHALPADAPERTEAGGVRIEHYGYLAAVRDAKDKSRRNLELLERQAREGGANPFLSFNLGTEHAALGRHPQAAAHFAEALALLAPLGGPTVTAYGAALVVRHVRSLRVCGRRDEALAAAEDGLAAMPDLTDLVLEQAYVARADGDAERQVALLERCLELGDAPSKRMATVGAGTFLAATALAGVLAERGDAAGAEALLLRTLADHPRFLGAVEPLARLALARGAAPAEVAALIGERCPSSPTVGFVLATALYETGHVVAAEAHLLDVVAADPHAGAPRLALAEALLSQSRWADAAAAAAAVADDAPHAGQAAVTQAFAAIVAGDAGATEAALARAEAVGTPAAHRALLGAWAGAAAGAPLPDRLPAGAAPLCVTVLEALLRVDEVDAFVTLLPALERVEGLSRPLRRAALAGLYERRGLLESAADEWMASVAEDGATAEAMLGLSRIAAATGADEDARVLADEARLLPALA